MKNNKKKKPQFENGLYNITKQDFQCTVLNKANPLPLDNEDAILKRAITNFQNKNYYASLEDFIAVREINPKNKEAELHLKAYAEEFYRIGVLQFLNGNYPGGSEFFNKVLILYPEHEATRKILFYNRLHAKK